jgi:hypothetical protein
MVTCNRAAWETRGEQRVHQRSRLVRFVPSGLKGNIDNYGCCHRHCSTRRNRDRSVRHAACRNMPDQHSIVTGTGSRAHYLPCVRISRSRA